MLAADACQMEQGTEEPCQCNACIEARSALSEYHSQKGKSMARSRMAEIIAKDLIERQGLSYEDVIRRCESEAGRVAAPYLEVADELRTWLKDHGFPSSASTSQKEDGRG